MIVNELVVVTVVGLVIPVTVRVIYFEESAVIPVLLNRLL